MKSNSFFTHLSHNIIVFIILTFWLPCFSQDKSLLPKNPVSISSLVPDDRLIIPMPLAERIKRKIVPQRGLCSTIPGGGHNDLLMSGSGKMHIKVSGSPLSEEVIFHHERLLVPWKMPFEAPNIAYILPEVRKLIMEGKYDSALNLSFEAATKAGMPPGTGNHRLIPAFTMKIDQPKSGAIKNYLRTLDFESGEIKVLWEDQNGQWERKSFVSRPDDVTVQLFTAPEGQPLNTRIELSTFIQPYRPAPVTIPPAPVTNPDKDISLITFERDFNGQRLIVEGHFNPETGNIGYAGVVRVVPDGGKTGIEDGVLVVEGAKSLMLITRVEWYKDFQKNKVDELISSLEKITPDYKKLLDRNREVQSAILDRVSLNFNTSPEENAMSGEELMADQKIHIGYNLTLLSKLFDMSRYWLMLESGDFPPIYGHLNINVNLQVSGGDMANLPEAMNAFYNWIEGLLPDSRNNARNIFGARGALFSVHPDQQQGVLYHWDFLYPHHYWVSAGGWSYSPFWDHYLVTDDKEFLRNRIMPGLKELALFYEDYLTLTDKNGNYIFVPSYSPENWPSNTDEGTNHVDWHGDHANAPTVINATMDIMVCREVLSHLIEGAEILGTESENTPKWKDMLAKLPNYLLDQDGAIKEWAWPALAERQDHRHISQMYGVWPADEIDPDRTPQLAKAAWLANRKRAQGNASGHGISHRALAAARLKDNYLVNFELKQLLEQGYFGPVLTSSHNPYTGFMPDQQGSVLTLMMEMLVYSRPGVIELLPALPNTIEKGNIKGILARSFAKVDDLTWDLNAKTIDLTITSEREQDISLIVRYGIESLSAPEGVLEKQPQKDSDSCILHLLPGKQVTLHLKIGDHKPSDWIQKLN
ncbi:MAG TPA: glycoside hydrolase N-terminal domain-containing protein [Bacteroidales bacterium]|nr:glycoside hydrolase N-terminal domain-containing protein [Bacteroidales bacterium]